MKLVELIAAARLRGATVHLTADEFREIAVVQVLNLRGMTTWPLPAKQAEPALAAALR